MSEKMPNFERFDILMSFLRNVREEDLEDYIENVIGQEIFDGLVNDMQELSEHEKEKGIGE